MQDELGILTTECTIPKVRGQAAREGRGSREQGKEVRGIKVTFFDFNAERMPHTSTSSGYRPRPSLRYSPGYPKVPGTRCLASSKWKLRLERGPESRRQGMGMRQGGGRKACNNIRTYALACQGENDGPGHFGRERARRRKPTFGRLLLE
jgi:hypothetical protein